MRYRKLGNTGLMVSEIGFGGEWLERHEVAEGVRLHWLPGLRREMSVRRSSGGAHGEDGGAFRMLI